MLCLCWCFVCVRAAAVALSLSHATTTNTHKTRNKTPKQLKQAAEHRPLLTTLFAKYVDAALEHCRKAFKTVVPLPAVNQVCQTLAAKTLGQTNPSLHTHARPHQTINTTYSPLNQQKNKQKR